MYRKSILSYFANDGDKSDIILSVNIIWEHTTQPPHALVDFALTKMLPLLIDLIHLLINWHHSTVKTD